MFRLWIFGAIISTATANAIYTGESTCIGECVPSTSIQYLPHTDCDKYCVCVSGQFHVLCCEPNNHWSQQYEICTYPAEAKCPIRNNTKIVINALDQGCKTECSQDKSILLAHSDCKKYCECTNNLVKIFTCPKGHFSVKHNSCVPVEDAGCIINNSAIRTITSTTSSTVSDHECIGSCPELEDPSHNVFLAHHDCNKYCHCKEGQPIVKNCSHNFLFNLEYMRCRQPKDVDCNQISSTTSISIPPSDKAIERGCRTQCPRYNALIPHENMEKYCHCRDGKVIISKCPRPYSFSTDNATCILSRTSSKLISLQTLPLTTSNEFLSSKPTIESFTPSTTGITEKLNDCVKTCPDVNSTNYNEHVKLPHRNCKKYCECYKGTPKVLECLGDSYFDSFFNTCDVIKYYTCYNEFTISDTSIPPNLSDTSFESTDHCIGTCSKVNKMNYPSFLKHQQCQKFCECFNGRLTVKSCPGKLYFNSNTGLCDESKYIKCQDETSELFPIITSDVSDCLGICITDHLYLTPHKHCAKYCECERGYFYVKVCPLGTYFNVFTKRCEHTEYDDCTKVPETSVTLLSVSVEGCAEECPYFVDNANVEFIPHKQCEKYCLCGNWEKPLVMSCGPNSHFNPTSKQCDYIENAGCTGITNMNTAFAPQIIPVPSEECPDCDGNTGFHTVLLKITGIKNGSEVDLTIDNRDNILPTSSDDEYNKMIFQGDPTRFPADLDEEHRFPRDLNGLVTILATLEDIGQCIGECPEPYQESNAVYLENRNCRRACKCTLSGPHVMECNNNYYWNPVTKECGPINYTECVEVVDSLNDEPKRFNPLYDEFKKLMGW